jgi:hypothetical protein
MHFRTRRNVVQLVRTTYDQVGKKPKTVVVGRLRLGHPVLSPELESMLSAEELREARSWLDGQYRVQMLREELAAVTLAETLSLASNWFARNKDSPTAAAAAANVLPNLQALRKTLKIGGLLV